MRVGRALKIPEHVLLPKPAMEHWVRPQLLFTFKIGVDGIERPVTAASIFQEASDDPVPSAR